MKNNTKVRLHLSKQLFESLTREIIKEAKANDGYTVAVKQPKTPKQSKAQATSPEVQKTDAEAMMGEAGAPPMPPVPGKSAVDKLNLAGANMEIKDAKTFAKAILDIAEKLKSKEGFKPESNPNIKRAMDALKAVSSGAPAVPPVPPASSDKPSQYKKPAMPPVPGQLKEMEINVAEEGQLNEIDPATSWEAIAAGMAAIGLAPLAIDKFHKWWQKKHPESFKKAQALSGHMDKAVGGNTPGQGHGVDPSKTFGPQNEISSEGIAALIGLIPGITLTAAIIKDIVRYMKDHNLKGIDGFKQAYKVVGGAASAHMDRKVGGNTPGQGHGVDPSKTFGPQNEDDTLKEYEQHYEMVNGQCRRYNDEGEYTVVSDFYCR